MKSHEGTSLRIPPWFKRSLFLLVALTVGWIEGFYLGPFGFNWVVLALALTIVLAVGWMRTYWTA
jgi:hypothetical protein